MLPRPDQKTIDTIKHAANLLSGAARRAFQAQAVLDHCNGNLSHAKTLFGWHQETVRRALLEKEKGEPIADQAGRGRKKLSEHLPSLQTDIRALVDPNSCTHPTFDNTFRYTRMTAKAVLEALVREKGYKQKELPALSTMRELLGKMGYRLRRVQKTRPQKKFPKPTRSSRTSKPPISGATGTRKPCVYR
jgi:hypothetical protein